jgi:hypothetical protein
MDNDNLLPLLTTSVAGSCKLPEYWPDASALWFSRAECSFLLRNVTEQREKFCLVVQSLRRDAMHLVADLVESLPQQLMYNALKEWLLHSHQLTDIQKVELLVDMPALGDRKPTQLLAAMVEACPRGQEDSVFMSALFLRKLPADVRILLAHMDHTRLKELATAADQLVAAVEADPGEVTARGGGAGAERKPAAAVKQKKKKPLEEPEPSKAARLAARLCLRHWRFGAQAFRCDGDCCWPGNGRAGGN